MKIVIGKRYVLQIEKNTQASLWYKIYPKLTELQMFETHPSNCLKVSVPLCKTSSFQWKLYHWSELWTRKGVEEIRKVGDCIWGGETNGGGGKWVGCGRKGRGRVYTLNTERTGRGGFHIDKSKRVKTVPVASSRIPSNGTPTSTAKTVRRKH